MPLWKIHGNGRTVAPGDVVAPDERLNWPATIAIGAQHVIAMFGATFLVPILTGFPVATTLLFSGIGTLLFLVVTKNKLPSYLGSSFAFIAPVTAATASAGMGSALAGIVAVGVLLAIIGVVVQLAINCRMIEVWIINSTLAADLVQQTINLGRLNINCVAGGKCQPNRFHELVSHVRRVRDLDQFPPLSK